MRWPKISFLARSFATSFQLRFAKSFSDSMGAQKKLRRLAFFQKSTSICLNWKQLMWLKKRWFSRWTKSSKVCSSTGASASIWKKVWSRPDFWSKKIFWKKVSKATFSKRIFGIADFWKQSDFAEFGCAAARGKKIRNGLKFGSAPEIRHLSVNRIFFGKYDRNKIFSVLMSHFRLLAEN